MELRPSEPQAFCVAVRARGATLVGSRVVPLTAVQTASDWEMTCSISVRRPVAVWSCVRMETGLVPRGVLQRRSQEQQGNQETNPKKSSAFNETHYCTSRAPVAAVLSRFVF